jgi:hypothetical protein
MSTAPVIEDDAVVQCAWCGKSMLGKEAEQRLNAVTGLYDILCEFDELFDTYALALEARAIIVAAAIDPELSELYGYPWI